MSDVASWALNGAAQRRAAGTAAEAPAHLTFKAAFAEEWRFVQYRRERRLENPPDAAAGPVIGPLPALPKIPANAIISAQTPDPNYRPGDPVPEADRLNLTGIALSGGGIRSAAICMGVFQGLDALSPQGDAGVINRLDYISAVSGGNYMATAIVAGMKQTPPGSNLNKPSFPFESKTDSAETLETQHIRDHANFLVPNGSIDYVIDGLLILRGLLGNALMLAGPVLLLCAWFVWSKPDVTSLWTTPFWPASTGWFAVWPVWFGPFRFTPWLALVMASVLVSPLLLERFVTTRVSLGFHEGLNRLSARLFYALVFVAFVELQPWIIGKMFAAPVLADTDAKASELDKAIRGFFFGLGQAGQVLGPVALALAALANKLISLAKANVSGESWASFGKRIVSRVGLAVLGLTVPLVLWSAWLNLTYRGIAPPAGHAKDTGWIERASGLVPDFAKSPFIGALGELGSTYLVVGATILVLTLLFTPNGNSLHKLYRDRLSRAFLMERAKLGRPGASGDECNKWTFSSLCDRNGAAFKPAAADAPYLLVNTAINLQSSYLDRRARKADVFTLGPLTCGSHVTGYAWTTDIEKEDGGRRPTLAAGMAISGAAASANMGSQTRPALTFSLAALNIRLGYWLPNPARFKTAPTPAAKLSGGWWAQVGEWARGIRDGAKRVLDYIERNVLDSVGPWWFARELLSKISDRTNRVHLTDGGHIENLGLYELIKRRCRVIILVDAEADPQMAFSSLIKAELMIRMDHGVRIHLPWPRIAEMAKATDEAFAKGEQSKLERHRGPHVAVGRIVYSDGPAPVYGVIVYVKASLSGDENDGIRSYKRAHSAFPHETTLDQFFSEEQFEMYRALGFHAAKGFFSGTDDAAFHDPGEPQREAFFANVVAALTSIDVPSEAVAKIIVKARAAAEKQDSDVRGPSIPRFTVTPRGKR